MPAYRKKRKYGRKPARRRYGRSSGRKKSSSSRVPFMGSAFRGGAFGGAASAPSPPPPPIVPRLSHAEEIRLLNKSGREILSQVKDTAALSKEFVTFSQPVLDFMRSNGIPSIVYGAKSLGEFAFANPLLTSGIAGLAYYAYNKFTTEPILVKPPAIVGPPVPSIQPSSKPPPPTFEWYVDKTGQALQFAVPLVAASYLGSVV